MTRVNNWESILVEEIEKAKNTKFKYGENDCTIWTANVVKAISDLEWEPFWSNKREAFKIQKIKSMEDYVSEILGPPLGNILLTQRGDIAQKGEAYEASLGVCIGRKVVFLTDTGICYADLKDCKYSWRI